MLPHIGEGLGHLAGEPAQIGLDDIQGGVPAVVREGGLVGGLVVELLFSRFYPEIFGEGGDEVVLYDLTFLLSNIAEGCLQDELEQYVYATEDVTLEMSLIRSSTASASRRVSARCAR